MPGVVLGLGDTTVNQAYTPGMELTVSPGKQTSEYAVSRIK